jgi:hypothetical protein
MAETFVKISETFYLCYYKLVYLKIGVFYGLF